MYYEDKKVISISKPLYQYHKKYIICVNSSEFWIIYDETDSLFMAKNIVKRLEDSKDECIIILNGKGSIQ